MASLGLWLKDLEGITACLHSVNQVVADYVQMQGTALLNTPW
jgi:hypothetical protein